MTRASPRASKARVCGDTQVSRLIRHCAGDAVFWAIYSCRVFSPKRWRAPLFGRASRSPRRIFSMESAGVSGAINVHRITCSAWVSAAGPDCAEALKVGKISEAISAKLAKYRQKLGLFGIGSIILLY